MWELFKVAEGVQPILDFRVTWKGWWKQPLIDHRRKAHQIWCVVWNVALRIYSNWRPAQLLTFRIRLSPSTNGFLHSRHHFSSTCQQFRDFSHLHLIRRKRFRWIKQEKTLQHQSLKFDAIKDCRQVVKFLARSFHLTKTLLNVTLWVFKRRHNFLIAQIVTQVEAVESWLVVFFFVHSRTEQKKTFIRKVVEQFYLCTTFTLLRTFWWLQWASGCHCKSSSNTYPESRWCREDKDKWILSGRENDLQAMRLNMRREHQRSQSAPNIRDFPS